MLQFEDARWSKCFILQRPKKDFWGEIGQEITRMKCGVHENLCWILVFQGKTKNESTWFFKIFENFEDFSVFFGLGSYSRLY